MNMSDLTLLTLQIAAMVAGLIVVIIAVLAVSVALLRWAFRINEQVALQREILANLRRINANTDQSSSSDNP